MARVAPAVSEVSRGRGHLKSRPPDKVLIRSPKKALGNIEEQGLGVPMCRDLVTSLAQIPLAKVVDAPAPKENGPIAPKDAALLVINLTELEKAVTTHHGAP